MPPVDAQHRRTDGFEASARMHRERAREGDGGQRREEHQTRQHNREGCEEGDGRQGGGTAELGAGRRRGKGVLEGKEEEPEADGATESKRKEREQRRRTAPCL